MPVITEGGSHAYAHLLIGPSSELFSTPVESSWAEDPVDEDAIAYIERETRRLEPSRPAWDQETTDVPDTTFLELADLELADLDLADHDA